MRTDINVHGVVSVKIKAGAKDMEAHYRTLDIFITNTDHEGNSGTLRVACFMDPRDFTVKKTGPSDDVVSRIIELKK